ncbi:MAG: TetR/AcrR family transcriptional regulator [Archangium sp.]
MGRRTQGVLGGRSDEVVQRVLDAALVELASSGFSAFRMEEVTAKAGVNKTTVYRRWPNRVALITALVERLRTPLKEKPLPDNGSLEKDLIEAFTRRFKVGRRPEGRAWARLVQERFRPEVEAIIGTAVTDRRLEWRAMVTRAIERGEVPTKTEPQLVFDVVRAIVDAKRSSERLDQKWLAIAVRTAIAGARAGTLSK